MDNTKAQLNTEQLKLVEDNCNLIYGFMTKHCLDFEQWYGICAIGLCMAASAYDGSYAFSTYAYRIMLNEVRKELRKQRAKSRDARKSVSLYTPVKTVLNEEVQLQEILASESKNEDYAIDKEWAHWFLAHASSIMLKIIYAKLTECKTCQQVSEKFDVSREAVNKQMRVLQRHIKEGTRPYCRIRYDNAEERKEWREKVYEALDNLCAV